MRAPRVTLAKYTTRLFGVAPVRPCRTHAANIDQPARMASWDDDAQALRVLIVDAWLAAAPERLADRYVAEHA